jgi:hypothetical protein
MQVFFYKKVKKFAEPLLTQKNPEQATSVPDHEAFHKESTYIQL